MGFVVFSAGGLPLWATCLEVPPESCRMSPPAPTADVPLGRYDARTSTVGFRPKERKERKKERKEKKKEGKRKKRS